ncbi:carbohydrate ABC transporter permease [Billgrantia endophytica]|uniref:ABC transporter permease n=1 Tax=Billgrantia endophytica TaxID=2033802 RepID=A0A2N7TXD2_9GAMM|nr:sugar ABC transporter permease [Halomonas endophytica]PMR72836.1 ABC transporter permease [Halomonas endophytica]
MSAAADTLPTEIRQAEPLLSRTRRRQLKGFAFVSPATLLLLLIYIVPLITLVALSLTDYRLGAMATQFIGLDNFTNAFSDPVFRRAFTNTLLYVAIVIPFGVGIALLVATLIHSRIRTRSFYEVVYFLPVTSTLVAMATVWQFILHPRLGPVNAALKSLGFGEFAFLSDPVLIIPTLAVIGVWQIVGFNTILFLAGLSAIPRDLYDAAHVDGATRPLDRFLTVTWPMLGPTVMFVAVTTSITAFKVFETVAVLTRGRYGSEVLLYSLYLEGFEYFQMGYAAALTLIFLAFVLFLSIGQALHLDRRVHY